MSEIEYRAVLPDDWPRPRGFSHGVIARGASNIRVAGAYQYDSGAAIGAAWMESLGKHFSAMTLVQVSGLLDPNAAVEIEAEAILP